MGSSAINGPFTVLVDIQPLWSEHLQFIDFFLVQREIQKQNLTAKYQSGSCKDDSSYETPLSVIALPLPFTAYFKFLNTPTKDCHGLKSEF